MTERQDKTKILIVEDGKRTEAEGGQASLLSARTITTAVSIRIRWDWKTWAIKVPRVFRTGQI
jgi:hypothetical protein